MDQNNSQESNNDYCTPSSSGHERNPLTPPLTMNNSQQHEQQNLGTPRNNMIRVVSSQPVVPFASWASTMSQRSITIEENTADVMFDQVEQLICDYMRQPQRHYLHCRVLRWSLEENRSRIYSAVVVINPPTDTN